MKQTFRDKVFMLCLLALLLPVFMLQGCGGGGDTGGGSGFSGGGGGDNPTPATGGFVNGTIYGQGSQGQTVVWQGVRVAVGSISTTSDSSGQYSLSGVAAGAQTITASAEGLTTINDAITITEGAVTDHNFTMGIAPFTWLDPYKKVKWQIEAVDKAGTTISGPEWGFTTGNKTSPPIGIKGPVTTETARKIAETHLAREGKSSLTIGDVKTLHDESGTTDLAYVFSLKPRGYIVVPCRAIEPIPPILAYSFDSDFSWLESPDNVLLGMLRLDIVQRNESVSKGAVYRNMKALSRNRQLWNSYMSGTVKTVSTSKKIGPLFQFEPWDQGKPDPLKAANLENKYCPVITSDTSAYKGMTCITGCVATAMGQILNYWKTPTSFTFTSKDNYKSEQECLIPGYSSELIKLDIDATKANFSGIDYNNSFPTMDTIAKISFACGIFSKMKYSPGMSSAFPSTAADALKTRLGYPTTTFEAFKTADNPTAPPFSTVNIISSLQKNAPTMLAIYKSEGGHAIVCDGYDASNSKFHLNYGWGPEGPGGSTVDSWYALPEGMPEEYTIVGANTYDIIPSTVEPVLPTSIQNPYPANSAVDITLDVYLRWDPTKNNDHYNVYVWYAEGTKPAVPTAVTTSPTY